MAFDLHAVERAERIWIAVSLALVLVFLGLVAWTVATRGDHIGHAMHRMPPGEMLAREPFTRPGVHRAPDGSIEAVVIAQAFSFMPSVIEVPAGETVHFHLASRDVIHGFHVQGTGINVELIPGEAVSLAYRFDRPGDYPLVCNQYCGVSHHAMRAMVRVVAADAEPATAAGADRGAAPATAGPDGAAVYAANCAACHGPQGQGMPPAFPPLAGHLARLLAADGGRQYVASVVTHGLAGEIEAAGRRYSGVMPPMAHLSDAELAAAIAHAAALGADAPPPTPAAQDIAKARAASRSPQAVRQLRPQIDD